jgi:hypothetical protein
LETTAAHFGTSKQLGDNGAACGGRPIAAFVILGFALVTSAIAMFVPMLLRNLAAQASVTATGLRDFHQLMGFKHVLDAEPRDPWGRAWRVKPLDQDQVDKVARYHMTIPCEGRSGVGVVFSGGPDGETPIYPTTRGNLCWEWDHLLLAFPRPVCTALGALLLAWACLTSRPRASFTRETLFVVVLTSVTTGLAGCTLYWLDSLGVALHDLPISVLPAPVVLMGTTALVAALLATTIRLGRR